MKLPPFRVIIVSGFLVASGMRSMFTFEPRSGPAGVVLPLALCGVIVAAGLGLLFGRQWARISTLVLCWAALVMTCGVALFDLIRAMADTADLTPAHVMGLVLGVAVNWLFILFLNSASVRGWTARATGPNQPPQRNAGSRPSSGDSSVSETPSWLGPRG